MLRVPSPRASPWQYSRILSSLWAMNFAATDKAGEEPVLTGLLGRKEIRKMFFSILLACLCRLANFLANRLPFIILIILNCVKQRLALILSKFCVVHILIPMFLDTTFGSCGESLGNLCPAVAGVPHLLQPQFLSRSPGSIRTTLFNWRRLGGCICAIRTGSRCWNRSLLGD